MLVNFHGLQGVRCSFDQLSACRPATSQSQDLGQGVGCRVGEGLQAFGSDTPRLGGVASLPTLVDFVSKLIKP